MGDSIIISSDESDLDEINEAPTCNLSFERKKAVRRDFISSESDDNLPDIPQNSERIISLDSSSQFDGGPFTSDTFQNERYNSQSSSTSLNDKLKTFDCGSLSIEVKSQISTSDDTTAKKNKSTKVQERKLQAQMLKDSRTEERLLKRRQKEEQKIKNAHERKLRNEVKRQTQPGESIKCMTVLIDDSIIGGEVLYSALTDSGVSCVRRPLLTPYSIQWSRTVSELSQADDYPLELIKSDNLENEVVLVIPINQFVQIISNSQSVDAVKNQSLAGYVKTIQGHLNDANITVVSIGMKKYFSEQNRKKNKKFKENITSNTNDDPVCRQTKTQNSNIPCISQIDLERSITETMVESNCGVRILESTDDLINLVKSFTKAVSEIPTKKNRLNSILPFHSESLSGMKVDRDGRGLLKNWKGHLQQFKNVSVDMADAIAGAYSSPQLLFQAYVNCPDRKTAEKLLENIQVRRGAGLLETNRRIGKELSRRIHQHITSTDPNFVIT